MFQPNQLLWERLWWLLNPKQERICLHQRLHLLHELRPACWLQRESLGEAEGCASCCSLGKEVAADVWAWQGKLLHSVISASGSSLRIKVTWSLEAPSSCKKAGWKQSWHSQAKSKSPGGNQHSLHRGITYMGNSVLAASTDHLFNVPTSK